MSRSLVALCLIGLATVASAAGVDKPILRLRQPNTAGPKTDLRIDGSTTVAPITECMKLYYEQLYPKTTVVIPDVHGWPGSSAGITGLATDTPVYPTIDVDDGLPVVTEIAQSSRTLKASDLALMPNGPNLKAHEIAKDALSVIVHPSNPIANLSITNNGTGLGDVAKIYKGDISSWFAVGGSCPGDQIKVYARNTNSGTLFSFIDLYATPAGYNPGLVPNGPNVGFVPTTIYVEDAREIVEAVAGDQCAIGFAGLGNVAEGAAAGFNVKMVPLQKGEVGGFPVVAPTKATARSGQFPAARGLYYITVDEPGTPDTAGRFMDFVYTRFGQRIVEETGFVSIYDVYDNGEDITCPTNG